MFRFEEGRMYQMPVHFGPCCTPRQDPEGKRVCSYGPQESALHTLVCQTEGAAVERFLPEGFSLRRPYLFFTHKMHRNLPWLAGRGYNVVTCNVPVTYTGTRETVWGQYQLAIWESHADPILCGREQLGYSKLYAEIEDLHAFQGVASAALSSWGFRFLELRFDRNRPPEDAPLLEALLSDPENEGLLHYKYIPRTGDGFSQADAAYVTLTPKVFSPPPGLPALPPPERTLCSGGLEWHTPEWRDMPTQYHIVQGLASLPVLRVIGAAAAQTKHYNDVYDQRIVR